MRKVFIIILFFFIGTSLLFSQKKNKKVLYGIGADYNFQTEGIGIDARAKIPVYNKIFVSPRIAYYPSFNKVHELYAGADLGYNFPSIRRLMPYAFISGNYDNWVNSSEFNNNVSKKNNFVYEVGVGIIIAYKCFYPYAEYRYDAKWKEGNLGIGLMLKFGECFSSKGQKIKKCARF